MAYIEQSEEVASQHPIQRRLVVEVRVVSADPSIGALILGEDDAQGLVDPHEDRQARFQIHTQARDIALLPPAPGGFGHPAQQCARLGIAQAPQRKQAHDGARHRQAFLIGDGDRRPDPACSGDRVRRVGFDGYKFHGDILEAEPITRPRQKKEKPVMPTKWRLLEFPGEDLEARAGDLDHHLADLRIEQADDVVEREEFRPVIAAPDRALVVVEVCVQFGVAALGIGNGPPAFGQFPAIAMRHEIDALVADEDKAGANVIAPELRRRGRCLRRADFTAKLLKRLALPNQLTAHWISFRDSVHESDPTFPFWPWRRRASERVPRGFPRSETAAQVLHAPARRVPRWRHR